MSIKLARETLENAIDDYVHEYLKDVVDRTQFVPDWLPIESAPRDGTDILLWFGHSVGWISLCKWYQKKNRGWCWVCSYDHKAQLWEPTHWMPLPEPPEPENERLKNNLSHLANAEEERQRLRAALEKTGSPVWPNEGIG